MQIKLKENETARSLLTFIQGVELLQKSYPNLNWHPDFNVHMPVDFPECLK